MYIYHTGRRNGDVARDERRQVSNPVKNISIYRYLSIYIYMYIYMYNYLFI